MVTYSKVLQRVLSGRADANIRFDDLRNLLTRLGFEERSRGSHHHQTPYQVLQVRAIITQYGFEQSGDE